MVKNRKLVSFWWLVAKESRFSFECHHCCWRSHFQGWQTHYLWPNQKGNVFFFVKYVELYTDTSSNQFFPLPAGNRQAWLRHTYHCSWTRTERWNTLRLWQNLGNYLRRCETFLLLFFPHCNSYLMTCVGLRPAGQQDGCGGSDGLAGGHSGHSCLCGQLVWEPSRQITTHGVCASGMSLYDITVKYCFLCFII